jgi:hypothetical protein
MSWSAPPARAGNGRVRLSISRSAPAGFRCMSRATTSPTTSPAATTSAPRRMFSGTGCENETMRKQTRTISMSNRRSRTMVDSAALIFMPVLRAMSAGRTSSPSLKGRTPPAPKPMTVADHAGYSGTSPSGRSRMRQRSVRAQSTTTPASTSRETQSGDAFASSVPTEPQSVPRVAK